MMRPRFVTVLFTCLGLVSALAVADLANPPPMDRIAGVSPEVVDKHGVLLRPFLTHDGYWRMATHVSEVSPRYLAMLKANEDKRFDSHPGVDPMAMGRAACGVGWLDSDHASGASAGTTAQAQHCHQAVPDDPRSAA